MSASVQRIGSAFIKLGLGSRTSSSGGREQLKRKCATVLCKGLCEAPLLGRHLQIVAPAVRRQLRREVGRTARDSPKYASTPSSVLTTLHLASAVHASAATQDKWHGGDGVDVVTHRTAHLLLSNAVISVSIPPKPSALSGWFGSGSESTTRGAAVSSSARITRSISDPMGMRKAPETRHPA
jgi:hypothetical protein